MENHHHGSNAGAGRLSLTVVFGAILLGGSWSLLESASPLVGTWISREGSGYILTRFDTEGAFRYRADGGFLTVDVHGSYQVIGRSGNTYRVRTQIPDLGEGQVDSEYRLESPDRLVEIDRENPEDSTVFTRTEDWVMASRPSRTAETYEGGRPHLGCWQRSGAKGPKLELLEDGLVLRSSGEETTRGTYTVNYSKLPFHLDINSSEGEVERGIFGFDFGGGLQVGLPPDGQEERPTEINRYQAYQPCSTFESRGG